MRQVIMKTPEEYAQYVREELIEGAGPEEVSKEVTAHLSIMNQLGGDVLTVTGRKLKDPEWNRKVIHVRGPLSERFVLRGQVKELQSGSMLKN